MLGSAINRLGMTIAVLLLTVTSSRGLAHSGTMPGPSILIHLSSDLTQETACSRAQPPCDKAVIQGHKGFGYFAYVLVTDSTESSGLEAATFGVREEGVTVIGNRFYFCDPSEGTGSPDRGIQVKWKSCQHLHPGGPGTPVVACAGYFYVGSYAGGRLSITDDPGAKSATVTNCDKRDAVAVNSLNFGSVVFESPRHLPHNPCLTDSGSR